MLVLTDLKEARYLAECLKITYLATIKLTAKPAIEPAAIASTGISLNKDVNIDVKVTKIKNVP